MRSDSYSPTVNDTFFIPITGHAERSKHTYPCPAFSDDQWIRVGIQRVLEDVPSGRAFLQEHGPRFESSPKVSNYFDTLHNPRRAAVLQDVADAVLKSVAISGVDRLAHIPELASYVCFAVDMHWHRAAAHDERFDGTKVAVGHCFSLDLHNHGARHLGTAEGEHEHDMSLLKRLKPEGLRQGVPKGTRVLVVYDRAGVDLGFWKRCRQEKAVYFLSRAKSNMIFEWEEEVHWDRADPRNRGVLFDQWVLSREGHRMRLVEYQDPETGRCFEYLTNEPDLPPGVLAELYRRRWELEKVFDEIKNKLGEKRAWASGPEARTIQARFLAVTCNLLLIYERWVESQHGVRNAAEDERRGKRQELLVQMAAAAGRALSTLLVGAREATQRSVKFVRWLRQSLRDRLAEGVAVARLAELYATL